MLHVPSAENLIQRSIAAILNTVGFPSPKHPQSTFSPLDRALKRSDESER